MSALRDFRLSRADAVRFFRERPLKKLIRYVRVMQYVPRKSGRV